MRVLLELDVLFGRYEMGTSLQKLYEDCDLGDIAGDVLSQYQYVLGLNFSAG